MKLSSARTILPVLMFVCLFSLAIRGMEVWTGVKNLGGSAFAVEAPDDNMMEDAEEVSILAENEMDEDSQLEINESDVDTDETADEVLEQLDEFQEVTPIQAELAEDLVKQRKRLEAREATLIQKEALLQAAEQELDRKYEELVVLRENIEQLLEKQSEEEDARINSLVKIYENMKPKEAATIFNTLDLDILVEVVSRMSERKVSPVMAAMNPERARTITIMLAEQKKLPELPIQ